MSVFGGILTKLLATVTAFMTVTAGVPYVQCVCPDGRVNVFYFASECCGNASSSTNPSLATAGAKASCSCCVAGGQTRTCCGHGGQDSSAPTGDGSAACTACGCEQSLVIEVAGFSAEKGGEAAQVQVAASVACYSRPSVVADDGSRLVRVLPPLHVPPTDLVVQFCHFTC